MGWLEDLLEWFKPKEVLPEPYDSGFRFSKRSIDNLEGVHPDLVALATLALRYSTIDFAITEGIRSTTRQHKLLADGKTTTLRSRHLTGHAIDIVAYLGSEISWEVKYYKEISKAFEQAANDLDIDIVWGGNWQSFKDYVHYQLDWASYPIKA